MYLILPFLAAMAFALGSMVYKRSYEEGAGVAHALVVNNLVLGLVFLPVALVDGDKIPWHLIHLPLIAGIPFVLGHLMNVMSLRVGDVSVATPILGVKVTFVALLAWAIFHQPLSPAQWIAAALTTTGVFVMGFTDFKPGQRAGLTTLLALGCAASFAVVDLLIQSWAGRIGVWNFLALQFASVGALSLATLPFFGLRSLHAPRKAWKWIALAIGLSGLQAILITASIGIWKDAAGVNVVYSTRGILSILLVWSVGHWMKNQEGKVAGKQTMAWRLIGAAFILLAVALAVKTAHRR